MDSLQQIKRAAERSLFYFISAVLGTETGFERLSPKLHKEMTLFLQDTTQHKKLMLVPREHFKTTLIKGMILHFLIQPEAHNIYFPGLPGINTCMLLCSDVITNSSKHLRVVETIIEKHKLFKQLWPHVQPGRKWSQFEMELSRDVNYSEPTLEAAGINTALASRHVHALFKDDVFTFKAMMEPTTAQKTILWHQSTVAVLRGNKNAYEIVSGTPWAPNDVYRFMLDKEGDYALYHRSAIENGEVIFPEQFTLEELLAIQRRLDGTGLFELNYLCDHSGGVLSDFKREWLNSFELDMEHKVLRFNEGQREFSPLAQTIIAAMEGRPFDANAVEVALGVNLEAA